MSKLKPFDLEKAKAGEKFTHIHDSERTKDRKFLAVRSDGQIIYEYTQYEGYIVTETMNPDHLHMVVESKKIKLRLYKKNSTGEIFCIFSRSWKDCVNSDLWTFLKEFEVEYDDE